MSLPGSDAKCRLLPATQAVSALAPWLVSRLGAGSKSVQVSPSCSWGIFACPQPMWLPGQGERGRGVSKHCTLQEFKSQVGAPISV